MYTYSEAVAVVEKCRMRAAAAVHRKRGNPPEVLKAMAVILGGYGCRVCGSTKKPELHHLDGIWRNYTPENLAFYCKPHHLEQHNNNWKLLKEVGVSNIDWSNPNMSGKLVGLVKSYKKSEGTYTNAYKKIASESKTHFGRELEPSSVENRYKLVKDVAPVVVGSTATVSWDEYVDMYRFAKKLGITITN